MRELSDEEAGVLKGASAMLYANFPFSERGWCGGMRSESEEKLGQALDKRALGGRIGWGGTNLFQMMFGSLLIKLQSRWWVTQSRLCNGLEWARFRRGCCVG